MTLMLEEAMERARLDLAQRKHTPTASMQTVAKRGIRMAQGRGNIDPAALDIGRKIASGQPITDDHVEHMAAYNAALDSPPEGNSDQDVEHMLWAGNPGAAWANARVAAMDVSSLSDNPGPSFLNLDENGKGLSLEIFSRDGLGEPTTVEADKGLIWAPILRSGMLATRPGPNGEKLNEPLIFVAGKASDPRKEIGLQNLLDNFNAGAVEHVTIPTTHENDVLSNTGFIKGLKIVDSKRRPGQQVLVAAHDFRDPDVRRKVELGTIANRSSGIVYDYTNTETGVKYDQVLDHVALTNRPWVRGMTPYGGTGSEDDFASREIVSMLLSEQPGVELAVPVDSTYDASPDRFSDQQWTRACVIDKGTGAAKERYAEPIREPDGTLNRNAVHEVAGRLKQAKGVSLAQKRAAARTLLGAHRQIDEEAPEDLRQIVATPTSLSEAERKALLLADVQWGSNILSMNAITDQVAAALQNFTVDDEVYPIYSVLDVTATPDPKALVRVNYGDPEGVRDAWVIPLEVDGDKVSLSDYGQWVPVQKEWVTDEDAAQDKQEVAGILGLADDDYLGALVLELSVTQAERDKAKSANNSLPDGSYPINNTKQLHSAAILAASKHGDWQTAQTLIRRRAKELGVDVNTLPGFGDKSKSNMSDPTPTPIGGAMPPTINEVIERLGLSDEQRAVVSGLVSENNRLRTNLSETTKSAREDRVKQRVIELQGLKFPPGFCRTYEEIALGDDGQPAATLNLSENGQPTGEKTYTATELAERLITALPYDESGALALAARGGLGTVTSPLSTRPPLTVADQQKQEQTDANKGKQTPSGEAWLLSAYLAAPEMGPQLAEQFGVKLADLQKAAEAHKVNLAQGA